MGNESKISNLSLLVVQYLAPYEPTPPPTGDGVVIRTTEEILNDLADMADLSPNAVAGVMLGMGYMLVTAPDGSHGWGMKPK